MAKAKATEKDPRNLPTGAELAASGYRGFNTDVGPAVEAAAPVAGSAPELPAETKPAKKRQAKR